jgi:inner membrane protein
MEGKTHMIGGVAAATIVYHSYINDPNLELYQLIYFYMASTIGSILPDICHPKSLVGRKTKIFSRTIGQAFGHRTITHSWIFLLAAYWLSNFIPFTNGLLQLGLISGIVSHFILDALTPKGIQFFYPVPVKVRIPGIQIKVGSGAEGAVSIGLVILIMYFTISTVLV